MCYSDFVRATVSLLVHQNSATNWHLLAISSSLDSQSPVVLDESPLAEKSLVARDSGDCCGASNLNCSPEQAHNIMDFQLPYCFFFLLLLLLLPFSSNGQAHSNISLGLSLTAATDNLPWTSPSGEFAFGFQQVGDAGYLLAIWFNKIPERTIVWSANRNDLVQGGSRVQLTEDGELVLNDQSGRQIWIRPQSGGSGAAYAAMLDTGNFVVASQAGANLWQSFDEPTDTLLPTQNLNSGAQLIAPYLEKNYSDGRFMFILQADGNLILYTTRYPTTTVNYPYWSTQDSIGSGYRVVFNQSGYMYLAAQNGTMLNSVFSNSVSMQDFYLRATIDYDGVLRQYAYPKTVSSSRRWPMAWTTLPNFIPSNICVAIRGPVGSGACGFNSYCMLGDDQRPRCKCPPGYTFFDPNDERKGCKKNFISQDCDHPSQEIDNFMIRDMLNTNFPYTDYDIFLSVDEDWCRQACLSDCYCAVATYNSGTCWKKTGPLSNGVTDPSIGEPVGHFCTRPHAPRRWLSTRTDTPHACHASYNNHTLPPTVLIQIYHSELKECNRPCNTCSSCNNPRPCSRYKPKPCSIVCSSI